jgi:hypothetical protein
VIRQAPRAMLLLLAAIVAFSKAVSPSEAKTSRGTEEFFIVSSIDIGKGRIVLKRPTEVTVVMRVTDRTTYTSMQGKRMRLSDVRAGDTAHIAFVPDSAGAPVALTVRLGPMTVKELERTYLKLTSGIQLPKNQR